jgi:hypothetical protein
MRCSSPGSSTASIGRASVFARCSNREQIAVHPPDDLRRFRREYAVTAEQVDKALAALDRGAGPSRARLL